MNAKHVSETSPLTDRSHFSFPSITNKKEMSKTLNFLYYKSPYILLKRGHIHGDLAIKSVAADYVEYFIVHKPEESNEDKECCLETKNPVSVSEPIFT